jgi:hypothetical protein
MLESLLTTPLGGRGHVLFTSRNRDLGRLGKLLEVPPVATEEGVRLVLREYDDCDVEQHMTVASSIFARLGGLALAITHRDGCSRGMLDEEHPDLPRPRHDTNQYTLGKIGDHNVVIACLPSGMYGTTSAAVVAKDMQSSFPSLRFGLMVGIGGGVPKLPEYDIRLGDVVVGRPTSTNGGVIQYDFGKTMQDGQFKEGWP